MNIRGLVVSVDYADLLAKGIERWHIGLDRLIVVTSPNDRDTIELCHQHNIETHITKIFYANGAKFNKGAALSEAVIAKRLREHADWMLTFDADIVPPTDWRTCVEALGPRPGKLHGTYRYWVPENAADYVCDPSRRMPQSWVLGFFMLFHATDPHLKTGPMFDLHWPHGGNYDTTFCRLWPKSHQVILPINMVHLGEERQNWCGRYKREDLKAILQKRSGHEDWERERMNNPPELKG